MKNIEKYQSLLETGEVDALLLTSRVQPALRARSTASPRAWPL